MRILGIALIIVSCVLGGCASGTGARWFAPATWFSSKPASTVATAEKRENAARESVIKAAQKSTHETAIALASSPASRPVAVASESNASAVALLDQAAGPLDVNTIANIRSVVMGLLSDNSKLRAVAEKQHEDGKKSIAEVSAILATAEQASKDAKEKLTQAFARENALANELRAQRALVWIAGGFAVVCALGWTYVRFTLGGFPAAIGAAKRTIEQQHPDVAKFIAPYYAAAMDRVEKNLVSKESK